MPMAESPVSAAPEDRAAGLDALLATKLHIPRARDGLVPRPRLADWLTGALASELTVVCAPAGFGKTVVLADWARRGREPTIAGSLPGWLAGAGELDAQRSLVPATRSGNRPF